MHTFSFDNKETGKREHPCFSDENKRRLIKKKNDEMTQTKERDRGKEREAEKTRLVLFVKMFLAIYHCFHMFQCFVGVHFAVERVVLELKLQRVVLVTDTVYR